MKIFFLNEWGYLRWVAPSCLFLSTLLYCGCGHFKRTQSNLANSVLRVTATIQYPDLHRPWLKKQPFTREGLATIIEGGRLLVTADLVAHSTYIELEKPEDGPKGTAVVEAIDEECDLAVLKPVDKDILNGTTPLQLSTNICAGSKIDVLQLEPNGTPALSSAVITTVAVMSYPAENAAYLLYRAAGSIPQREGSFVIPALHEDKLAGLVVRYDPRIQAADIIPAPIIGRFLTESTKPGYSGLARAGLSWEPLRGTTLREWMGAGSDRIGVFVTSLDSEGPSEKAGLKKGDLIMKVDGKSIDGDGNYTDPTLGKITFNNLASLGKSPGDRINIEYFRTTGVGTGIIGTANVTLSGRNPSAEISPSILEYDSIPYMFLGGLLFQELSRPYLREWGPNWRKDAPLNLLYLDEFQKEFPRTQKRFVILSAVLPTPETIGMENLGNSLVEKVNGRPIHCLADIAEAAKHPDKGFDRIDLEGSSGPVYLDAATLNEVENLVRERYGVPESTPKSQGLIP